MEANKELTIQEIWDKHNGQGDWDCFIGMDQIAISDAFEEYANAKLHLLQQELDGHKEWAEDYKILVREIAVALNGDDAAKQPSLCDLVSPIKKLANEYATLQQEYDRHLAFSEQQAVKINEMRQHRDNIQRQVEKLQQEYEALKSNYDSLSKTSMAYAANKLQQEYEALQRWKEEAKALLNPIFEYAQDHPDMKLGGSMIEFVLDRCNEYDKLSEENNRLRGRNSEVLKLYKAAKDEVGDVLVEHAALKEKAEKMETALGSIASSPIPANEWENFSWIETARQLSSAALSSYNSQTNNQNENNENRD